MVFCFSSLSADSYRLQKVERFALTLSDSNFQGPPHSAFIVFLASALSCYLLPPISSLPLAQPPLPHLNLTRFLVLNCHVRSEKESLLEVCIKPEFTGSE